MQLSEVLDALNARIGLHDGDMLETLTEMVRGDWGMDEDETIKAMNFLLESATTQALTGEPERIVKNSGVRSSVFVGIVYGILFGGQTAFMRLNREEEE